MKVSPLPLLLVLALPGVSPAQADRLFAGYEIEWQGLPIGTFETELSTGEDSYRVSYRARTTGILGWLFPFTSEGSSEGTRAMQVMPARYQGQSSWRDDRHFWVVRFDGDGRVTQVELPEEDRLEREPVPASLQVAPDPLALALRAIGAAAPGARLDGASFDGKRALRFELACADDLVPLADPPPGAAAAAEQGALACTVNGELAAGASRRWKGSSMRDDDREPVAVWLGRGILKDAFWPVRVEAPTSYGTVTARLVSLQPESTTPAAN